MSFLDRIQGSVSDKFRMLPQSARYAVLARQRANLWRQTGVVFIHVPKAAGTSINLALYGEWMGHARACDIKRWAPTDVSGLPMFAVTRNPWDRLVSAYRFARRGGGSGGAFEARPWRPEQFQIPEFESFERFVTQWLVRKHMWLDPIFQPQSNWICDRRGTILVDHLGRVENLESTLSFLARHLPEVPVIPLGNRSGDWVDYRTFYTPELAKLVGKIYRADVECFEYNF